MELQKIINSLSYDKLKKKVSEERKEHLKLLNVVNNDENAIWLIDYWCGKDIDRSVRKDALDILKLSGILLNSWIRL